MIAIESSARYEIETWNSFIGFGWAPRGGPPGRGGAPSTNHAPRAAAHAVYSQPMPNSEPSGHSSSDTTTVSQDHTALCRPTDSAGATTGSIGTPARA